MQIFIYIFDKSVELVGRISHAVKSATSAFHNRLTSPLAFKLMLAGGVLWAVIFSSTLISGIVALLYFGVGGAMVALWVAAIVVTPLSAILAGYLTLTKSWPLFFRWFLSMWAWRKDKKQPVTTSNRVIRDRLRHYQNTGFYLTAASKSWLTAEDKQALTFNDDRHVCMLAGSRGGKGISFIIPNLLHWKGSAIIYDPAGENYRETYKYRSVVLGQKIVLLDPFGVTGDSSATWNPMAEIDFRNDPQAIDKCYMIADSLIIQSGNDPYWSESGKKLLAMVVAYVGADSLPEDCHLGMVRDLLHTSDLKTLWTAMARCKAFRGIVASYAEGNLNRNEKELSSVVETVRTSLKWLDSEVMETFSAKSSFAMRDLKREKASVYLVLPAGMGDTYKMWLRLLFNAAFDGMQDMSIPKPKESVLFIMDEFPLLGRMERIKRAAGEAAKFGVKLFIIGQDKSQLQEHYGDQWETFIANSGLLIMFANNDLLTQQYLSERLGQHEVKKVSVTTNRQGGSTSTSTELQSVMRADEVAKAGAREHGTAFVFIAGQKPMKIPRIRYYEEFADELAQVEKAIAATNLKLKPKRPAIKPFKMPDNTKPNVTL